MVNLEAVPALEMTPIVKPVVHAEMNGVIVRVSTIPTIDSALLPRPSSWLEVQVGLL